LIGVPGFIYQIRKEIPVKRLLILAATSLALLSGLSQAADAPATSPKATAQQSKMGECNAQAGARKGDERKAFMKECLSAKKPTQQDKMKTCNKEAGEKKLKGDERKKFMRDCLKG
jgi:opacity protein-like surface antigen